MTLTMTLLYSSVPVSRDGATGDQNDRDQDRETEAAMFNT